MQIRPDFSPSVGFQPAVQRPAQAPLAREVEENSPQEKMTFTATPGPSVERGVQPPLSLEPIVSEPAVEKLVKKAPSNSNAPLYMESSAVGPPEESSQSPITACLLQTLEKGLENPQAQATWSKMTPAQRNGLRSLLIDPSMTKAFAGPGDYTSVTAAQDLAGLVTSGRILDRDKNDDTVISHLIRLQTQDLVPELEDKRGVLVAELAANLNRPGEIDQRNRGTCAATALEYLHAKLMPADYARVTIGLMQERQDVKFAGGEPLHRNPTSVDEDDSGRSNIDRIYQSSLMQHGATGQSRYNNNDDSFYTIGGRNWRASGLPPDQSAHIMGQIFDKPTHFIEYSGNRVKFEAEAKEALAKGQPVWISMRWDVNPDGKHARHAVALESLSESNVHMRNSWGFEETGSGPNGEVNGPERTVEGNRGEFSMTKDNFYQVLDTAAFVQQPVLKRWVNSIRYDVLGDQGILKKWLGR